MIAVAERTVRQSESLLYVSPAQGAIGKTSLEPLPPVCPESPLIYAFTCSNGHFADSMIGMLLVRPWANGIHLVATPKTGVGSSEPRTCVALDGSAPTTAEPAPEGL